MSWEDLRKAFVIMTYFTSWNIDKMAPDQIAAKCLTHVTYAYAKIANGVVVPGDAFTDLQRIIPNTAWVEGAPRNFHGAMQALTHPAGPVAQCNPNLKKLISIGGWTWSGEFSNVAKTPESRTKFANSVVDYIVRHGFDGCELDWEYPVAGGQEGNAVSPDDTLNFVLLLQEIRHRMDLYRIGYGGAPMLLTAATAAGTDLTNNLDIKGMSKILDFFNLMIYDFAGAWENVTAHNSPFNPAFIDTIKNYLDREAPPRQLVAGIPLFGKQFEGARSKGIGVPYDTIKEAISYDEIQDTLVSSDGYEADWDADAKAGFLWNGRKHEFVTYEHPNSSFIKAEYVRRKQLLGVFLWEVSMDRYAVALRKALSAFGLKRSYRECFC